MSDTRKELPLDEGLAEEAKTIVALAFRNGPIEDVHAGIECERCAGKSEYSHITQNEMKQIMKFAVNKVYALLWIRSHAPEVFLPVIKAGALYASAWDPPENSREEIEHLAQFADMLAGARKLNPVTSTKKGKSVSRKGSAARKPKK